MAPHYIWGTLVSKWGNRGELALPGGRIILTNMIENSVCPHMCHGSWHIEERGGNGLSEMEWYRCPVEPPARCGAVGISPVPIEGWVINTDKYGLLDGLGDAVCLPVHKWEAVQINGVSSGLAVLVNGWWVLRCSFSLCLKVLPVSPITFSLHSFCCI